MLSDLLTTDEVPLLTPTKIPSQSMIVLKTPTAQLTKHDTPEVTYISRGAKAGLLCMFFIILCVNRSVVRDSFEPMHAGACVEGQDTLQG